MDLGGGVDPTETCMNLVRTFYLGLERRLVVSILSGFN